MPHHYNIMDFGDSWFLPTFSDDGYRDFTMDDIALPADRIEYPVPIFTTPTVPEDKCQKKEIKRRPKRIFKPFFTGFVDSLTVTELNKLMKKLDDAKWKEMMTL